MIDNCPVETGVAVGGDYNAPGEVYSTTILNRNSRYLFVIFDTRGDGICCNKGPEGYYEIYMDNVLQAKDGKYKASDTAVFGACSGPTSKPTNLVRHLYIVATPLFYFALFSHCLFAFITCTANCKPNQHCQFEPVSYITFKLHLSLLLPLLVLLHL